MIRCCRNLVVSPQDRFRSWSSRLKPHQVLVQVREPCAILILSPAFVSLEMQQYRSRRASERNFTIRIFSSGAFLPPPSVVADVVSDTGGDCWQLLYSRSSWFHMTNVISCKIMQIFAPFTLNILLALSRGALPKILDSSRLPIYSF